MRLAVIHIGQETNTFNPQPTTLRDFEAFGIFTGPEMFDRLSGVGEIGGYLAAVDTTPDDIESVPIIRAWAGSGGRLTVEAHEFFLDAIRVGLRTAGNVDGLALHLHGGCSAITVDDVEGAQLAACREVLGDEVPIVVSLDHHANVTHRMVELSTAIIGYRTQPHDPYDTGKIAAQLLIRIASGNVAPVVAWRKLRLLTHQEQYLTSQGPMKVWFDRAREMEAHPQVLHVSNFPVQPWLDVEEGGWATTVVTDGKPTLAEDLAHELAELAWSMRSDFMRKESISVDDAVLLADQAEEGVVVLSDTGDSVFGGAAGDSNIILESIVRLGIGSRALIPIVDPDAVAFLVKAGIGASARVSIGGAITSFFPPIEVNGTIRSIREGPVEIAEHSLIVVDMGTTVVFDVSSVTLLVTERPGVGGNIPTVYRASGVEPSDYKIAVLKTASNFQYFASITSQVIRVDTPGPSQSDIGGLSWERIPRPIYGLDPIESWQADRAGNP